MFNNGIIEVQIPLVTHLYEFVDCMLLFTLFKHIFKRDEIFVLFNNMPVIETVMIDLIVVVLYKFKKMLNKQIDYKIDHKFNYS